jgi:alanyl-tRNA synthetase
VRAGGKHNDLENVGYTARHHTFFEMLGNFSFGDYFKREAIVCLGVSHQGLQAAAEKLWVTVYEEDDEAADIWLKEIGVDPAAFRASATSRAKSYESDNFWAWAIPAPADPAPRSSTITARICRAARRDHPEEDGDRYIEIWNLVFMQFDRDKPTAA